MQIRAYIHTCNSHGSHKVFSLAAGFLELNLPPFGSAVRETDINVYFRSRGAPETLAMFTDRYEPFLLTLPTSKLHRKKGKLEISYVSGTGDSGIVADYGPPRQDIVAQAAREMANALGVLPTKLKKTDDFDAPGFLAAIERRLSGFPNSPEAFAALQREVAAFQLLRNQAMNPWDRLGVDWKDFHPSARTILDDVFYWDGTDDFSPNGNDTGADVLALYQKWRKRHRQDSALSFLEKLLRDWDVKSPPVDQFSFDTVTEAAVGLAFAQLKVDGRGEEAILHRALDAIKRQREYITTHHRDWNLFTERMSALDRIETKLQSMLSTGR